MFAPVGRPSIPPEKLLRAQLLQMLYSIRSERLLVCLESRCLLAGASPVVVSPESHVAGFQCFRVTGGAEAEYPSEKEVQDGRPYHEGNPAASIIAPKGTKEGRATQHWWRPRKR